MRTTLKLLVGIGVSAALSAGIGACSDTTQVVPPIDGSLPETGVIDANPPTDSSPDVKPDAPVTDGGNDAFDGFDGYVGYTAPQFRDAMLDSFCGHAKNTCCTGKPFDNNLCKQILEGGFEYSTYQMGIPNVDFKNIEVDLVRANACINGIAAETCFDKTVQAAAHKTITQDCFAALKGKLNADDPCHADIECKPGLYCEGGYDPGTNMYPPAGGACKALKQLGDTCHQTDNRLGDNCSTRGSGDSGRYCAADNTCTALIANDGACALNNRCQSGACDPASFADGKVYCKGTLTDSQLCTYFAP